MEDRIGREDKIGNRKIEQVEKIGLAEKIK